MIKKYRKRPVVIEAIQLTKDYIDAVLDFLNGPREAGVSRNFPDCKVGGIDPADGQFKIKTLEGPHVASPGDYIIKGVAGEFYPCKPDIFEKTYEEVAE